EQDPNGELAVTYENRIAAAQNYYHLPSLLARDVGGEIGARLARGEVVEDSYERGGERVWFYARAIQNASRLESVLTQERLL
ncbi:MAG TPA: hypothetical protein VMB20_00235, partial [Candidatus Acidoferrum sp.]|nr:hypothetical protein [Candidatus Acidoferrum sp.]